jgi:protein O-mannosyl-transferase
MAGEQHDEDQQAQETTTQKLRPTAAGTPNQGQIQRQKRKESSVKWKSTNKNDPSPSMRWAIHVLVHLLCIGIYLYPILQPNPYGGPTLDEMHIMSSDNQDIQGDSSLLTILKNDYWGRPMQKEDSHKSWRPLTVLSLRHLKGLYNTQQLTTHRIVNILAHATAADLVGILATRLFPAVSSPFLLHIITKIVFALHPTHVEVTANAANRNHIMAVICSLALGDPYLAMPMFFIALIAGFLISETFLFQIPAAIVTMVVIANVQILHAKPTDDTKLIRNHHPSLGLILTAIRLLPRIMLMILSIAVYLGGRYYFDTLDIPEGLIRPAENPFYTFAGMHRVRNYMYVLSVHILKSYGMDPIGFSHEYGFDCIPALEDWNDPRLFLPASLAVLHVLSLLIGLYRPRHLLGYVLIHFAWLLTLFPVSGLVKVGTFVSDRIVVPSSVSVCFWVGFGLYYWLTTAIHSLPAKPLQALVVGWLLMMSYLKIHNRALDWMDSISLMSSGLKACPRFAKLHMEMSKIYSGLYPDKLNLQTSLDHLEIAREIDPNFCDLHQQFAHVAIQRGDYYTYEEELTQAVLCPFTMGGAFPKWQQYWQVAENNAVGPTQKAAVKERQAYYTRIIQDAVQKEREKEMASTA